MEYPYRPIKMHVNTKEYTPTLIQMDLKQVILKDKKEKLYQIIVNDGNILILN